MPSATWTQGQRGTLFVLKTRYTLTKAQCLVIFKRIYTAVLQAEKRNYTAQVLHDEYAQRWKTNKSKMWFEVDRPTYASAEIAALDRLGQGVIRAAAMSTSATDPAIALVTKNPAYSYEGPTETPEFVKAFTGAAAVSTSAVHTPAGPTPAVPAPPLARSTAPPATVAPPTTSTTALSGLLPYSSSFDLTGPSTFAGFTATQTPNPPSSSFAVPSQSLSTSAAVDLGALRPRNGVSSSETSIPATKTAMTLKRKSAFDQELPANINNGRPSRTKRAKPSASNERRDNVDGTASEAAAGEERPRVITTLQQQQQETAEIEAWLGKEFNKVDDEVLPSGNSHAPMGNQTLFDDEDDTEPVFSQKFMDEFELRPAAYPDPMPTQDQMEAYKDI